MHIIMPQHAEKYSQYALQALEEAGEWLLLEIRLTEGQSVYTGLDHAQQDMLHVFRDYDGRIFLEPQALLSVLIRWGAENDPLLLLRKLHSHLPPNSCETLICPADADGLKKIELHIQGEGTAHATLGKQVERRVAVLLADDDLYIRNLVRGGIQPLSFHAVAHGDEVMEAYTQYRPAVVFLDIHLPGKNGPSLLREILAHDKDAFVVMLSADSSPQNVSSALANGAKGFLTKPFTRDKLLDYVTRAGV